MILHGSCLDVLQTLDAESIDACVTDPPYGIGFMGREWDTFKPGVEQSRIVPNRAWPANVLLDEEAAAALDAMTGELVSNPGLRLRGPDAHRNAYGAFGGTTDPVRLIGDSGGASRFYYVAKSSREERDFGCEGLQQKTAAEITGRKPGSAGLQNPRAGIRAGSMNADVQARVARNFHPTVKPVELMRWLVRLVTPLGGTVLDPFLGSGTTGMACRYESRQFVGIEREADYIAIAERRIAAVAPLFADERHA